MLHAMHASALAKHLIASALWAVAWLFHDYVSLLLVLLRLSDVTTFSRQSAGLREDARSSVESHFFQGNSHSSLLSHKALT